MRSIALALALALVACSSSPPLTRCTPGAQVACPCPGGSSGVQACAADGASYTACACGTDAGAPQDVQAPQDTGAVAPADVPQDAPADASRDAPPADAGPPACADGLADCDGIASNGCETDITTLTNCGGCGRACPSGGGYRCCPRSALLCPRADSPCG